MTFKVTEFAPGLFRGPRPVSETAWFCLHEMKIKTILNLESGFYERLTAHRNHETLESFRQGILPLSIRLSNFFSPTVEELQAIVKLMNTDDLKPLYIHCRHGKDRTGMAVAAYRILEMKLSSNFSATEMVDYGFHLFPYFFWLNTLVKLERLK